MNKEPLVIIGTGLAGYNLAKEWRKYDQNSPLLMLTADTGEFYSKPMLSTAIAQHKIPEQLPIAQLAQMQEQLQANIETQIRVEHLDLSNKTIHCNHRTFSYRQLVLALGASPIRPKWTGNGASLVHSVNGLIDYQRFRNALSEKEVRRIVIIGSGLVGCEFANDLTLGGYEITLVSLEATPLARLIPAFAGTTLAKALSEKGVQWHFEETVQAIHYDHDTFRVALGSGQELSADLVLSACGLKPQTTLTAQAGLSTQQGITVSSLLASSDPNVFAIGDCAQVQGLVLQYVAPLMQGVRALAKTLSGTPTKVHYPAMPVSVKTTICPVLVYTPPGPFEWRLEQQEGYNLKATAWNTQQQLAGFVLTGSFLRERLALTEQLPPMIIEGSCTGPF